MGVTVKNAGVSTSAAVNITKKVGSELPLLGGFTIGENSFVFAARRPRGADVIQHHFGQLFKVPMSGGNMSESYLVYLGHGNDIAYYNGNYYVAMGNRKEHSEEKQIAKFTSNLENPNSFNFISQNDDWLDGFEPLKYISKICHYSHTRFIVGNGFNLAVCKLNEAERSFEETGRFDLEDDRSLFDRDGCERAGQGIFYANYKIYNILSYKKPDEGYKYNDIAVYRVSESRNTLKTSLETVYRCDFTTVPGKEDMNLFEIEGIAALNGTDFYIDVNQRNAANNPCDAIYRVYLN